MTDIWLFCLIYNVTSGSLEHIHQLMILIIISIACPLNRVLYFMDKLDADHYK